MTKLSSKILSVNNRRTSIRRCCQEWKSLDDVSKLEKLHRNKIISLIESHKSDTLGLAYATRLFMMLYYKKLSQRQKAQDILSATLKELR